MPMPGGYRRTPKIPPAAKEAAQEAVENRSQIRIGSRVTIIRDGETAEEIYTVVSPDAVDAKHCRLPLTAPLIVAVGAAKKGGVASYEANGQLYPFKIIKIE